MDENVNLTTLDMASNRVSKLDNLQKLEKMEEFWFNDNQVGQSLSCADKLKQGSFQHL